MMDVYVIICVFIFLVSLQFTEANSQGSPSTSKDHYDATKISYNVWLVLGTLLLLVIICVYTAVHLCKRCRDKQGEIHEGAIESAQPFLADYNDISDNSIEEKGEEEPAQAIHVNQISTYRPSTPYTTVVPPLYANGDPVTSNNTNTNTASNDNLDTLIPGLTEPPVNIEPHISGTRKKVNLMDELLQSSVLDRYRICDAGSSSQGVNTSIQCQDENEISIYDFSRDTNVYKML